MTGQRQSIKVRAAALWNLPTERESRHGSQLVEKSIPVLSNFLRFVNINRWRFGLVGYGSEVLFDQRSACGIIEIPGHRKHGVIRRVINAEELAHDVDGGRVQLFHRSDRRMCIGMAAETH